MSEGTLKAHRLQKIEGTKLILEPMMADVFIEIANAIGVDHYVDITDRAGSRTSTTVHFDPWYCIVVMGIYQHAHRLGLEEGKRTMMAFFHLFLKYADREVLEAAWRLSGPRALRQMTNEYLMTIPDSELPHGLDPYFPEPGTVSRRR